MSVVIITAVAAPVAKAAVQQDMPRTLMKVSPIRAQIKFPPTKFLGWEKAESGKPNKSTLEAPSDATIKE